MVDEPSGVDKAITAAGGAMELANAMGVRVQAIYDWKRRGYFPVDRAKFAALSYDVPLRELVAPNIRDAMDAEAERALLA